jgi:excisionase family DNA binding protein
MTDQILADKLLTPWEAAQILNISRVSLYRMVKARSITFVCVGGQFRFKRRALLEWIDRHEFGRNGEDTGRHRRSDVASKRMFSRGRT